MAPLNATDAVTEPTEVVNPPAADPAAGLTERDVELGMRLTGAMFGWNKQSATLAARMSKLGIERTTIMLLKTLAHLGPSRSGTLAEAIHSDPSTVSRQVATLVKDGLVQREADPDDGRASVLVLTDAGRRLLEEQRHFIACSYARMVAHWDPDELATFAGLLERFVADHANYLPTLIDECVARARNTRGET